LITALYLFLEGPGNISLDHYFADHREPENRRLF
jgi:hypothetical protein